jgi:hypothetical protein
VILFAFERCSEGVCLPLTKKCFLPAGQHKTKKNWGYCKTLTFGLKKVAKSTNGGIDFNSDDMLRMTGVVEMNGLERGCIGDIKSRTIYIGHTCIMCNAVRHCKN